MMENIFFSSTLSSQYREQLETIMFFNPHQSSVEVGIIKSIEKFGIPKIAVEGKNLKLHVENLPEVQTLYAFEEGTKRANLIGALIYVRIDIKTFILLHISVSEEYSCHGIHADKLLAMRLVIKLREIASRIKGACSLIIIYGKGKERRLIVRKQPVLR